MMDDDQKKCAGISCGSFMVISLSVAMIIIGCINVDLDDITVSANVKDSSVRSDTCSIEPKIPFFLIVAGILNIALWILRIIFQRCCKKCCDGDNSENAACATCGFLANCACITFYDAIALTLIIIWLVIGSYWMFPHWDGIKDDTNEAKCVAYLYWFSVVVVILSWISVVFGVLCGILAKFCECFWSILCCKPCRQGDSQPV
jgi:hypothetical protein